MSEKNASAGMDVDAVDAAGVKPFRLVKFFSYTGLVVFLVFALVLSWLISKNAKKVLLERSEAYSLVFAENLSHQVFQQFVIPTVVRYGKIALRNPSQFSRLDSVVRNNIHGMRVESVTIFDSKENVISYSTIEERVGMRDVGGPEYERAREGENNFFLSSSGSLLGLLPGAPSVNSQLKSYIPFRQEEPFSQNPEMVMGVIEVVQDLSDDLEAIIRLQGTIIVTSILMMGLLFMVLRMIVARADRIIEARASERRRFEEKLHQSERLASLGKMVASVSHEIKNPLGIVRSTAEILEKRLKKVAPGNEHLASIIIEETTRLDAIVREFLDFARPQTPSKRPVSVNDIIERAVQFMMPAFARHDVIPELALDQELPPVPLDQDLVYRAFLNILVNSVQAMPEGGSVRAETRVLKKGVGVEVLLGDTGVGMSIEKQQHVFTPFFTDKNRGSGLGLSIVKNIIDSHGGKIAVESEEGRGTTFRITLPAS
jgi:signal transduction histidine kinase